MIDEQLLIRFLSQECSQEELDRINHWVSQDKNNAEWLFDMERVWILKEELKFDDKKKIKNAYQKFISNLDETNIHEKKSRKLQYLPIWTRYAAAVIILLLLVNIFRPDTSRSPATLSDNILEVPKGQSVTLVLSDGTKVVLNSDSRLTYPAEFTNKSRTVKLEGEGYFEVEHNEKIPFIVDSHNLSVKVLGTRFNIRSYPGEITSVALHEGKVEVYTPDYENKVTLNPNERVEYSLSTGMQFYKNVDTMLNSSWTDGEMGFEAEPLSSIMKTLERKFNVKTLITDERLETLKITTRINSDANIIQVLDVLRDTRNFDYIIENGTVTIFKK